MVSVPFENPFERVVLNYNRYNAYDRLTGVNVNDSAKSVN
jgi:hypothetical protein